MAKPCICTTITINADNKWLDIDHNSAGETSVEILMGTYASIFALADQIEAELQAHVDANYTCSVMTTGLAGRIQIHHLTHDFDALWKNGTHGTLGFDTSIGNQIGFIATDDDSSTSGTLFSDYQATQAWFSTMHPVSDTDDKREHIGSNPVRTLDGSRQKRLTVSTPRNRDVEFKNLPPEIMWTVDATAANTNRDFETLWLTIVESEAFEYFPDQTASAAHETYYLKEPSDFTGNKQLYPATELYDLKLSMARQE